MKIKLLIIGIMLILVGSLTLLVFSQQAETECLRLYKKIHENNKTPEMQLAESEIIQLQKLLILKYVEKNCPQFTDLDFMYKAYTGNNLEK